MAKKDSKKDGSTAELELIKTTLETDLDESSVDIFSQDLFAPKPTAKPKSPRLPPEPEKPRHRPLLRQNPLKKKRPRNPSRSREKTARTGKQRTQG